MAELFGTELGIDLPSFGGGFAGFGTNLITGLIWFAVIIGLGIVAYVFWSNSKYKYKIQVFENLGTGGYVIAGHDRAKLVRLGDGGEMIIKLKKYKCFRTAYGRKMGHNTYWFAVGQDGYWYNCVLGDLDAKQGMLDIEPIDRDMRYMHVAIRKNIQDRYRKTSFMDKFGGWVLAGIFMLILFLGIWFLITKMGDVTSGLSSGVESARLLQEGQKEVLSALNNLLSNSGISR